MSGSGFLINSKDERFRVLCVGEEPSSLRFRRLILERRGYAVVTAGSPAQARELVASSHFDLAILELESSTAKWAAAEIKRAGSQVRILLVSHTAEVPEPPHNFDACVSKAAGPYALLTRIEDLLPADGGTRLRHIPPLQRRIPRDSEALHDLLTTLGKHSADFVPSKGAIRSSLRVPEPANDSLSAFGEHKIIAEEELRIPPAATPAFLSRLAHSSAMRTVSAAAGIALSVLLLLYLFGVSHRRITKPPSYGALPATPPSFGTEMIQIQPKNVPSQAGNRPGPARRTTPAPVHSLPLNTGAVQAQGAIETGAPVLQIRPGEQMESRLEPFELPVLPQSAPSLGIAAAAPPIARSIQPAVPNFVLHSAQKGHSSWVTAVAFDPNGQLLASASWDQTIKFWDVATGRELSTLAGKGDRVEAVAFSRDGQLLAAQNSDNTVTLWNTTTGREIRSLSGRKPVSAFGSNWVYSIAFSPDDRWLAYGLDERTVRLWEVTTGRAARDLSALPRSVIYIAFSPDGRWLASGGDDKSITAWDVASGKTVWTLRGHKKSVYAIAFSPNGRLLASASGDRSVKIWDMSSGRELCTLTGHHDRVTSVVFSPDGRWLASGSWDNTVKIWDVDAGREVQTLSGHEHDIYSVAFDPSGRWLASGSQDGMVELWRSRPEVAPSSRQ